MFMLTILKWVASVNLKKGWELIKKDIDTDEPAPANLYLGCKHEIKDVLLSNGVKARKVIYNMEDYLKTIVEKNTRIFAMRQQERG